jgi:hypothetical protein
MTYSERVDLVHRPTGHWKDARFAFLTASRADRCAICRAENP